MSEIKLEAVLVELRLARSYELQMARLYRREQSRYSRRMEDFWAGLEACSKKRAHLDAARILGRILTGRPAIGRGGLRKAL